MPNALRLPFAAEFSPGQVNLGRVLEIAQAHAGDSQKMIEAFRAEYFVGKAKSQTDSTRRHQMQEKLAYNLSLGMQQYGLLDASAQLTALGTQILQASPPSRAEILARDILRNRHGAAVLEAVRALQSRDDRVSKESLARELQTRGFDLPRATTHHLKLLQWLREAGVISRSYQIDESVAATLFGVSSTLATEWKSMTDVQRAFVETMRRLSATHATNPIAAKHLTDQVEAEHGKIFKDDQLRKQVFTPLEMLGWFQLTGVRPGRGAKSGQVASTQKLIDADLGALTSLPTSQIPPEVQTKLDLPLSTVHKDLKAADKHTRGIALEVLAVRLATDLGLVPLRLRLRGTQTGGAEVDLIAEGSQLHFSRWLFQCKNASTVALSAVAKEVGMASVLRAHVVVMVTTGTFKATVRQFAEHVTTSTELQVVLVDRTVLAKHRDDGPNALRSHFRAQALDSGARKARQLTATVSDDAE